MSSAINFLEGGKGEVHWYDIHTNATSVWPTKFGSFVVGSNV